MDLILNQLSRTSSPVHGVSTPLTPDYTTQLTTGIPSIHHNICPSCIRTRITSQIQISPFEFPRIRIPSQWREPIPFILHLYRTIAANGRVDVSGANAVDTGEASPLYG